MGVTMWSNGRFMRMFGAAIVLFGWKAMVPATISAFGICDGVCLTSCPPDEASADLQCRVDCWAPGHATACMYDPPVGSGCGGSEVWLACAPGS